VVVANKDSNVDVKFYFNKGDKFIKKRVFELQKVVQIGFCKSDLETTFSSV